MIIEKVLNLGKLCEINKLIFVKELISKKKFLNLKRNNIFSTCPAMTACMYLEGNIPAIPSSAPCKTAPKAVKGIY